MKPIRLSAAVIFLASCAGQQNTRPDTREATVDRIQDVVAQQATAEILAWRESHPGFTPEQIRVRPSPAIDEEARVWQATLPIDHFHPFTLLESGDEIALLGGFPNPQLELAVALLGRSARSEQDVRELVRALARLADPNGAQALVFPGERYDTECSLVEHWNNIASPVWRPDTVFRLPSGNWLGRVTVLSQEAHSYALLWVPLAYSFVISPSGELISWYSRAGAAFAGPSATAGVEAGE